MRKTLPKLIRTVTTESYEEPVHRPIPEPPVLTVVSDAGAATTGAELSADAKMEAAPVAPAPAAQVSPAPSAAKAPASAASEHRRHEATKLVERFAFWAGAAGAIPVPLLDLAGIGAVQVQMVRRLAEMYDVDFSQTRGKALIAAAGGASLTGSSSLGAASLTKAVPVLGAAISSIAVPTLGAGATFAIGIAFIEHFETGGTLLDFKMPSLAKLRKK